MAEVGRPVAPAVRQAVLLRRAQVTVHPAEHVGAVPEALPRQTGGDLTPHRQKGLILHPGAQNLPAPDPWLVFLLPGQGRQQKILQGLAGDVGEILVPQALQQGLLVLPVIVGQSQKFLDLPPVPSRTDERPGAFFDKGILAGPALRLTLAETLQVGTAGVGSRGWDDPRRRRQLPEDLPLRLQRVETRLPGEGDGPLFPQVHQLFRQTAAEPGGDHQTAQARLHGRLPRPVCLPLEDGPQLAVVDQLETDRDAWNREPSPLRPDGEADSPGVPGRDVHNPAAAVLQVRFQCPDQHGPRGGGGKPPPVRGLLRLTGSHVPPPGPVPELHPGVVVVAVGPAGGVDLPGRDAHRPESRRQEGGLLPTAAPGPAAHAPGP